MLLKDRRWLGNFFRYTAHVTVVPDGNRRSGIQRRRCLMKKHLNSLIWSIILITMAGCNMPATASSEVNTYATANAMAQTQVAAQQRNIQLTAESAPTATPPILLEATQTPSSTPVPQVAQVLQESTDGHWILMVLPIRNTSSTCDQVATLGEWNGCDAEVERKLLDLYYGKPGAGIVYVNSYPEAGAFLISRGWNPNMEIRGFHLEEFRLDPLHDGEGRFEIKDLALLPLAADHDGAFLMTWDVLDSLYKWRPDVMTPVP